VGRSVRDPVGGGPPDLATDPATVFPGQAGTRRASSLGGDEHHDAPRRCLLARDQPGPVYATPTVDPEEGTPATSNGPSAQLFRANVESCTYFFGFIALISALFWVFFYLI